MDKDKVQRVPEGLLQLLSLQGGRTPSEIENSIQGALDLLQFYGLTQLQTGGAGPTACAVGVGITFTPAPNAWSVLFAATGTAILTATMTTSWLFLGYQRRPGATMPIATGEVSATAAVAGNQTLGAILPYPLLLPPGATLFLTPETIGVDATVTLVLQAEYGVLG